MSGHRVVVVTGANRGIGRAICQTILSRPDLKRVCLFAASRSGEDLGFDQQSIKDAEHEVIYRKLDISDPESVHSFADAVVKDAGDVDVLINNAGVNLFDDSNPENIKRTFDVNFRGTRESKRPQGEQASSFPLPRIVNLSSVASSLKFYSPALQQRFRNPELSLSELESIAGEYLDSASSSSLSSSPFGPTVRSYGVSKALVTALTRILARENKEEDQGVLINSCCPGWISTEMGNRVGSRNTTAPKTAEEGARIPLFLAFDEQIEREGINGVYWANESVRSKDIGKVMEW